MNNRLSLFLKLPVLAAMIALAGCDPNAHNADTIKVGAIVELTGDMPAVGASSRNAAQLAVAEINGAGGIEIGGKT
ncbi:ABC transporter substrate-binding protein, partial [uncultured Lamprocystis sp.]